MNSSDLGPAMALSGATSEAVKRVAEAAYHVAEDIEELAKAEVGTEQAAMLQTALGWRLFALKLDYRPPSTAAAAKAPGTVEAERTDWLSRDDGFDLSHFGGSNLLGGDFMGGGGSFGGGGASGTW
ncbi:hypothetical protein [Phenylobacterium soli]|uniref:hypothetical protein n=1 Tax=Phenylobacterium soli TaxID=2170551 RepID=UPI001D05A5B2|nr:hypothetical protein [Phenylobacterium soli]